MEILFKAGRAYALDNNKEIGICTFVENGDIWTINHTIVSKEYGGQGIAKKLVEKVVEEARKEGKKLQATCSYAVRLFEKSDAYDDVLAK